MIGVRKNSNHFNFWSDTTHRYIIISVCMHCSQGINEIHITYYLMFKHIKQNLYLENIYYIE